MWRLPRALLPIYATTLVETLGYTLMIPLLPEIVKQYGASDVMTGSLLSIPALCSMIAAPVWGKLSDRLGRKRIILIAQGLTLIGYLMQAMAPSLIWIFISRIISGSGGGALGAVQSYIADVTKEEDRDLAYSLYGAVFGVAFIIGPVASGFLIHRGLAVPFFIAAGIEAITILITIFLLPSSMQRTSRTSFAESLKAANVPGVRLVLIRHFLAIFAIVCFLANLALYLHHVLGSPVSQVGSLLSIAGVVGGAALIFVVTPLAKHLGDRRVAQIGLLLSFAAYVGLAFVNDTLAFAALLIGWAIGSAMVEPTLTALLSVRAKRSERGAIMGVSDSINSVAMILAPAAGSAIVGANARYLGVLPACTVLAAFLMGRYPRAAAKAEEAERVRRKVGWGATGDRLP
ncbi:MAG: MFS transporter [Candidatus Eremiobacteraeota bacterium]|nr:MFS transporter [Candidatus Eremiobacteraeota bacterium]